MWRRGRNLIFMGKCCGYMLVRYSIMGVPHGTWCLTDSVRWNRFAGSSMYSMTLNDFDCLSTCWQRNSEVQQTPRNPVTDGVEEICWQIWQHPRAARVMVPLLYRRFKQSTCSFTFLHLSHHWDNWKLVHAWQIEREMWRQEPVGIARVGMHVWITRAPSIHMCVTIWVCEICETVRGKSPIHQVRSYWCCPVMFW